MGSGQLIVIQEIHFSAIEFSNTNTRYDMAKISKKSLKEIKSSAEEYVTALRGKKLTKKDILYAETLMKLGYIKAKLNNKKKEKRTCRKNKFPSYSLKKIF